MLAYAHPSTTEYVPLILQEGRKWSPSALKGSDLFYRVGSAVRNNSHPLCFFQMEGPSAPAADPDDFTSGLEGLEAAGPLGAPSWSVGAAVADGDGSLDFLAQIASALSLSDDAPPPPASGPSSADAGWSPLPELSVPAAARALFEAHTRQGRAFAESLAAELAAEAEGRDEIVQVLDASDLPEEVRRGPAEGAGRGEGEEEGGRNGGKGRRTRGGGGTGRATQGLRRGEAGAAAAAAAAGAAASEGDDADVDVDEDEDEDEEEMEDEEEEAMGGAAKGGASAHAGGPPHRSQPQPQPGGHRRPRPADPPIDSGATADAARAAAAAWAAAEAGGIGGSEEPLRRPLVAGGKGMGKKGLGSGEGGERSQGAAGGFGGAGAGADGGAPARGVGPGGRGGEEELPPSDASAFLRVVLSEAEALGDVEKLLRSGRVVPRGATGPGSTAPGTAAAQGHGESDDDL